jgi:hypothetical protein
VFSYVFTWEGHDERKVKGKAGQAATILRPLLDSYMDAAVAIVGCAARDLSRYSCEFDLVVVTDERRPSTSIRLGGVFADINFITDKEVLKPQSPEHALALALAKAVRDTSLIISTGSATSAATFSESAESASRARMSSALKTLGRSDEALSRGALIDADFWLLAASYEFGYALLLKKEVLPSPSHLLSQLRGSSKGALQGFEGVSMGAGLEAAGRAGCGARLEGVVVLHDLLRGGSGPSPADSGWPPARTEILSAKAQELVTRIELAECYSFLGQELVDAMLALLRTRPKQSLTTLTAGKDRLLGERLVRQLGLVRREAAVRSGLDVLRKQVAALAKA